MNTLTESHADEQPDLVLSAEQSLSENLRRLLATRWDIRTLLADSPPSVEDRKMLWRQLDSDMALAGITVPDRCSGSGAGLSTFIVDMRLPGITVRPLKQMTAQSEFNEVFLDDVAIPPRLAAG